jgi:hypothetical protein
MLAALQSCDAVASSLQYDVLRRYGLDERELTMRVVRVPSGREIQLDGCVRNDALVEARVHQIPGGAGAYTRFAVYAGRELIVEPWSHVVVSGIPAVLIFDRIEIRRPGRITFYTPFELIARTLITRGGIR